MSKRVSIILPDESAERKSAKSPRTSSSRPSLKKPTSPRSSSANAAATKPEAETAPAPKSAPETSDSALVKLSMTDLFADDCERYKKDCCCCHCIAVRRALKQAAFLRTPEGKDRLELRMHMKNLFMDINAITFTRQRIENRLHGDREYPPPANKSFPISITHVAPISPNCMAIDWYLHDDTNVTHYEIYVDTVRRKRVFDAQLTSTVVLDVDMKRTHKIRMKAVPKKGLVSQPHPIDRLVRDVCCGGLNRILDADYFCQCGKKTEMEKVKEEYKRNACQKLVDFWKDSEFIYIPVCACSGHCTCDCFAEKLNACPKH